MKKSTITMITATALLAAGCASSSVSTAPDGDLSGDLVLRASSAGKWSVSCSAETTRGNTAKDDIKGRSGFDFDVIVLRDVVSASCSYVAEDEPLTLTLSEEGLSCPFGAYENGTCELVIASGQSGSFEASPE